MRYCLLAFAAMAFLVSPLQARGAEESANYFVLKAGGLFPTDDLEDLGFDAGFNGEMAVGHYLNRYFSLELGSGYFRTETDEDGADSTVWTVPLTVTARGSYTLGRLEAYAGLGGGVYFVHFDFSGAPAVKDRDALAGGHVMAGAHYFLTDYVFMGVEGKYTLTEEADLDDAIPLELNINGFTASATLGFRF
ncbi:MAG: outer membrane beta-barrel protein [Nitrospirota bacterium]